MVHYSIIFIWIYFLRLMETNSTSMPESIKVQNVLVVQNIEGLLENHSALRVMPLQKQRKSSPVWAVRYMLGIKGEKRFIGACERMSIIFVTSTADISRKFNEIEIWMEIEPLLSTNSLACLDCFATKLDLVTARLPILCESITFSDDHLLAQLADASDYPAKKDVSVDLLYTEKGGTGDILTYIEIDTLQDTQEGNAHVVSGGIGQRSIHIVLEAKQTERFSYNAHFYGRKTLKLMTH